MTATPGSRSVAAARHAPGRDKTLEAGSRTSRGIWSGDGLTVDAVRAMLVDRPAGLLVGVWPAARRGPASRKTPPLLLPQH